jgi:TonB family protein
MCWTLRLSKSAPNFPTDDCSARMPRPCCSANGHAVGLDGLEFLSGSNLLDYSSNGRWRNRTAVGRCRQSWPVGGIRAGYGKSGVTPKIGFAVVLLFASVAAGQQPCRPQRATAMTPFDVCKYWPLPLEGVHAPRALSAPDPELPEAARKAHLNGDVVLVLAVNEKGGVDDARAAHSSNRRFEQNAIDPVKQWEFAPATKDGKPVAVQIHVEITFESQ